MRHSGAMSRFANRDLELLEFNARVLEQAKDKSVPLLERIRFLAIFESNTDEFFMKRMGHFRRLKDAGSVALTKPDARPVDEVMAEVRDRIRAQIAEQTQIYTKDLVPELKKAGVELLKWKELKDDEILFAKSYFQSRVFPVLTPLAVDRAHPFPFVSNLSVSLGVKLHQPKSKDNLFARLKIPNVLPQWIRLTPDTGKHRYVRLIDLIEHHLEELFPEMVIEDILSFRVTRSADVEVFEDESEDLMDLVEDELRRRRLAPAVRMEVKAKGDPWVRDLLLDELEISEDEVFEKKGEIDYLTLHEIAKLNLPEHRYKHWSPVVPEALVEEPDIFKAIRKKDILVHHPYESFSGSVERFVRSAVEDPNVLAIKMTLYRTEEDSPFIPLLIRAAEEGKQVVCMVELQARFDEARNIYWGELLENAGVHVVYGIVGLKTHTKTILVVRNESEEFKFYAHVGTGNYNSQTAKLYTDLGLFTADPKMTGELIEVFNYLTGLSLKRNYKKFLIAPINMRERFLEMIKSETSNKKKGLPARIIAKMNNQEDAEISDALYEASQAGVEIDLIVRGFCCIRPGVKGLSENIRVRSVVGRFLEHSRIFYFQNGKKDEADGKFYISSADWMSRNLNSRVESAAPIENKSNRKRILDILKTYLNDDVQSWRSRGSGQYLPPKKQSGSKPGCQEHFMSHARK